MKFTYLKKGLLVIGLVAFALGCPNFAAADSPTALIFDIGGGGGSISYAQGGTLSGNGISVSDIYSIVGGTATATHAISGATLEFTSGNLTTYNAGTWTFSGGGSITITPGTVFGSSSGTNNLLQGTFKSVTVTQEVNTPYFQIDFQDGAFTGKNGTFASQILTNYNIGPSSYTGNVDLTFLATTTTGNGFTSLGGPSGKVSATVPLPASALLIGSGFLGLIGYGIRRQRSVA